MTKFKNILSLNATEAQEFLLQDNQYHTFELPEYFNFEEVLQFVKKNIGDRKYEDCIEKGVSLDTIENVCLRFLLSKDGQYSVRPLTLSNPVLYWMLVREICSKPNWELITSCFKAFQVPHITACALPIIPEKKESFHKSTAILNWWNSIEQRTLQLSMRYSYMFVTDITNCYGSFNPQSIEYALAINGANNRQGEDHKLATRICRLLKDLQQGSNIGIPQGSTLYDLIAELILGFADSLLYERLSTLQIEGYEVLRYRDDYRIFCNDRKQLEEISYVLQSVLESLNLHLNSQKTYISENLVYDALKQDKRDYILNTPILGEGGYTFKGLQKHLYFIYLFARGHKEGGQIKVLLDNFDKRLLKKLYPYKEQYICLDNEDDNNRPEENSKKDETIFSKQKLYGLKKPEGVILENIHTMVAIATQIAFENVSAAPIALRVISRLLTAVQEESEKTDIMEEIVSKLSSKHNMSYLEIWLQNMTYSVDKGRASSHFEMPLCRLARGENVEIWNLSWVKQGLLKQIPVSSICNSESLENLPPVIVTRPIRDYAECDI